LDEAGLGDVGERMGYFPDIAPAQYVADTDSKLLVVLEAEQDGVDSESIFVNPTDVYILDSDNFNPEDADIEEEIEEAED